MLIRSADLTRITKGEVTLAFRRWRRPTVKAGGTLRTAQGLLAIHAVEIVDEDAIAPADARAAGFSNPAAARAALGPPTSGTAVYRIRLAPAGYADPRDALRQQVDLRASDVATLSARLARFDDRSPHGPWTAAALHAIASQPGVRAADLAAGLGVERLWFKTQVRKLKALGLTESLEVGYRLSPRGEALQERLDESGAPADGHRTRETDSPSK